MGVVECLDGHYAVILYKFATLYPADTDAAKFGVVECLDTHYAVTLYKFATLTPADIITAKLGFIGELN